MIPLFKSHYSIGRSILTTELPEESKKEKTEFDKIAPDSIIDLARKYEIPKVVLVEDRMAGFLSSYYNFKETKIDYVFGLRLTVCANHSEKTPESKLTNSKYIIFLNDESGYQNFIKIYSFAARDGFYYEPRIDFKKLKEFWHPSLSLAVPFYDSFIHKNNLSMSTCIPDFSFTEPAFFLESNNVIFDDILAGKVKDFAAKNKFEIIPAKSVYYAKREDFQAYLTFRCIYGRGKAKDVSLQKPNLEFMSSEEFCLESWREQV